MHFKRNLISLVLVGTLFGCSSSVEEAVENAGQNVENETATASSGEASEPVQGAAEATETGGDSQEVEDETNNAEGADSESPVFTPNEPPVIRAEDQAIYLGSEAIIDAAESYDPDGTELRFDWTLLDTPAGSEIFGFEVANEPTLRFTPDVPGEYRIQLWLEDQSGDTEITSLTVDVTPETLGLDFVPGQIAYSASLDKLIMTSYAPNQLHILDPESGEDLTVALNKPATAISVGTKGYKAVVGHDGAVSVVNLSSATLENVWPTDVDAKRAYLSDNGLAYLTPASDDEYWGNSRLYTLNTMTGSLNELATPFYSEEPTIAVVPEQDALYLISDFGNEYAKFSTAAGQPEFLYQKYDYASDYYDCRSDSWIISGGARMIIDCGKAVRLSEAESLDMVEVGGIPVSLRIGSLSHSPITGEIALLQTNDGWYSSTSDEYKLFLYEDEALTKTAEIALPKIKAGSRFFSARGEEVFHSSDPEKMYVVIAADTDSNLLNNYAVWVRN